MSAGAYVFMSKSKSGQESTAEPSAQLSETTRGQLLHVLKAMVGRGAYADRHWRTIVGTYDYESGTSQLGVNAGLVPSESSVDRFFKHDRGLEVLDLVGVALSYELNFGSSRDVFERHEADARLSHDMAVVDINRFLREGNVPYQFERGQWVEVTSGYVFDQIVRPALDALDRPGFEGALDEFTTALAHARDGRAKEAATEATKALESTIKCICTRRGWTYPDGATAAPLFRVLVRQGLVPDWMENGFMGAATIRNKASAHGQGAQPSALPPYMASLAVNVAGTYITALIAAHDATS